MREEVRKDILDILKRSYKAIKELNVIKLKELSNCTLHCMSIYQDEYSSSIAIIIYSLAKIFDKEEYKKHKEWSKFYKGCLSNIEKARRFLVKNDLNGYENSIKDLLKLIKGLEKKFGLFINEVLESAKVKKGSRVYEHGISSGRVAELLGVSEWELRSYIGKTKIDDFRLGITKSIKERLELIKKLFGAKR